MRACVSASMEAALRSKRMQYAYADTHKLESMHPRSHVDLVAYAAFEPRQHHSAAHAAIQVYRHPRREFQVDARVDMACARMPAHARAHARAGGSRSCARKM
jgi:hypothetical protein